MWCDHCRLDVKTVVSPLGGPPRCSQCGKDLSAVPDRPAPTEPPGPAAGDGDGRRPLHPRELLARWAREETLPPLELGARSTPPAPGPPVRMPPPPQAVRLDASHPLGPVPVSLPQQLSAAPSVPPAAPISPVPAPTPAMSPPPVAGPHFGETHFSQPPVAVPQPQAQIPALTPATGPHPVQPPEVPLRTSPAPPVYHDPVSAPHAAAPPAPHAGQSPFRHRAEAPPAAVEEFHPIHYADTPHGRVPQPHFTVQVISQPAPAAGSPIAAQVIAFTGVLGLTLGTFILLYTHFLAAERDALLAPGWVVAAVSQLVLLLGVVMLVSAGLSQTSQEVAWRVESLGQRLARIERSSAPPDGGHRNS